MLERAIENWLTKTNERNFQIPFCQVLMHEGHKILYVSQHRPMEQGKDIVSRDLHGTIHAYQLKTGPIDLPSWRRNYGEFVELIELPVVLPGVGAGTSHVAWLVANGQITDEVRIQIDLLNRSNQAKGGNVAELRVIEGLELCGRFRAAQGEFVPHQVSDFGALVRLYTANGRNQLPKDEFARFLNSAVFSKEPSRKSDVAQAAFAGAVIVGYSTKPWQDAENYFALFEAWALFGALLVGYQLRNNVDDQLVEESISLAVGEARRCLLELWAVAQPRRRLFEGSLIGDGAYVYGARVTLVLGALCALANAEPSELDDFRSGLWSLVTREKDNLWYWGDSAWPFYFNIIAFISHRQEATAAALMNQLLSRIVTPDSQDHPIAPPYVEPQTILSHLVVEHSENKLPTSPDGSYVLDSLIETMARRGCRTELESAWPAISSKRFQRFAPRSLAAFFTWRTDDGVNESSYPAAPASWKKVTEDAIAPTFLDGLERREELIRYFALAAPHRMSVATTRFLDSSRLRTALPAGPTEPDA